MEVLEILDKAGPWRLTRVRFQGSDRESFAALVEVEGKLVFPDCGWGCENCEVCLGCARKLTFSIHDEPLKFNLDPYALCHNFEHHVPKES